MNFWRVCHWENSAVISIKRDRCDLDIGISLMQIKKAVGPSVKITLFLLTQTSVT